LEVKLEGVVAQARLDLMESWVVVLVELEAKEDFGPLTIQHTLLEGSVGGREYTQFFLRAHWQILEMAAMVQQIQNLRQMEQMAL
jgi:hypothetical protein